MAQFFLPFRPALDANALSVPGAKLYFYATGTSTPVSVYSDAGLTTPLTNPVTANAAGKWPVIHLADATNYRVVLKDAAGATLDEADPYDGTMIDSLTTDLQTIADEAVAAKNDAEAAAATMAASLDRLLMVPSGETIGDIPALATRKGGILGFDASTGEPTTYVAADFTGPQGEQGIPGDLVGADFVLAETFKSVSDGLNWRPAIQAALDYAVANSIPQVRLPSGSIQSWQPAFPGGSPNYWLGHHLRITGDVALVGAPGGTTLVLKNPTGSARAQGDGVSAWSSGWLVYDSSSITKIVLHNLTVQGGLVFSNVLSNAESNVRDKGILISDGLAPNLVTVDIRNVELTGFAGEIFYMGGSYSNCKVYAENLTLRNSPQACWNPGTLAQVVAVNLIATDSYQPAEQFTGKGHTYIGGLFGNGSTNSFIGLSQYTSSYPYWWPARDLNVPPPWLTFIGTRFEKAGSVLFSSWTRGNIVTVDTTISPSTSYATKDVYLEIEAWADHNTGFAAVDINGPASTTTAVSGAPGGTYYPKTANIQINVVCRQTAQANGWTVDGINFGNGLLDKSTCAFKVEGTVRWPWKVTGTPVAGWALPQVTIGNIDNLGGATSYTPSVGTNNLDILQGGYNVDPPAGTSEIAINTTYGYKTGQRVVFIHSNSNSGRIVLFRAGANGLALTRSRRLISWGDLLELEYSQTSGKWHEVRYQSSTAGTQFAIPTALTDGATVTPNFGLSPDFEWTIGGNRTLANPTNAQPGQTGTIRITQDGTGSRTITYGSNWRFPGGSATGGVLSTAAGAVDVLRYTVGNDGLILSRLDKAMAA